MLIRFLYVLYLINFTSSKLLIRDAGISPINPDDITMIFYVTLENTCTQTVQVHAEMIKCFEKIGKSQIEYDSIILLGNDINALHSECVGNITLLYPNLYLENRVGNCLVSITYQNGDTRKELIKEFDFDTTSCNKTTECDTIDLDPRDNCLPVDCPIKYAGARNYFNRITKLCTKVPLCLDQNCEISNNYESDILYVPQCNICQNLGESVSAEDLEQFEMITCPDYFEPDNYINIRCHHGSLNKSTGLCVCHPGWTTRTCTENYYQPELAIYHMCNLEINSWNETNQHKIAITILAILIFALAITAKIFLAICILNLCYKWIRAKRGDDHDDEECVIPICSSHPECQCDDEESSKDSDIYTVGYIPISRPFCNDTKDAEDKKAKYLRLTKCTCVDEMDNKKQPPNRSDGESSTSNEQNYDWSNDEDT